MTELEPKLINKKEKLWEYLIRLIQHKSQWEASLSYHVTSHIYVFRPTTDLSDILKFEEWEIFSINLQHTPQYTILEAKNTQRETTTGVKSNPLSQ